MFDWDWFGCSLSGHTKAEKTRAIPLGAGYGPGDAGEAGVGLLLPTEAIRDDGNGMSCPLILADRDRPWL
jgi:hypothetical protein